MRLWIIKIPVYLDVRILKESYTCLPSYVGAAGGTLVSLWFSAHAHSRTMKSGNLIIWMSPSSLITSASKWSVRDGRHLRSSLDDGRPWPCIRLTIKLSKVMEGARHDPMQTLVVSLRGATIQVQPRSEKEISIVRRQHPGYPEHVTVLLQITRRIDQK